MNDDLIAWNDKFYNKDYSKKVPGLTLALAKKIGDEIGVDWDLVDLREWIQGIKEEMEHTDDSAIAKKIAKDQLDKDPKYYTHMKGAGLI